jgi:hypothetical protein
MAISSLDKNSIGICLSLLLVIILSESRLFNFFTDTYLGRAFLIIIILFASYLHKILGVVCVLIIIIMFNNNNFSSYYEGFDANDDKKDEKSKMVSTTTTTGDNKNKPITTPTPVPNDKIDVVTSSVTTSQDTKNASVTDNSNSDNNVVTKAIEGFDLQSTENNIKRGKQSNSIPVNQYNKQSIEVDPYENSSFSNFFGLL